MWTEESTRCGLLLTLTVERTAGGLRATIEDLSDDYLGVVERALARV